MKKHAPSICPVAFSVDIFGDSWSLIILRDIIFNDKSHFRELLNSPEKIASNILSARLETMVQDGLLTREPDPANKSATIYRPTKKALDLIPMLFELMLWGIQYNQLVDLSIPGIQRLQTDPEGLRADVLAKFENPAQATG